MLVILHNNQPTGLEGSYVDAESGTLISFFVPGQSNGPAVESERLSAHTLGMIRAGYFVQMPAPTPEPVYTNE